MIAADSAASVASSIEERALRREFMALGAGESPRLGPMVSSQRIDAAAFTASSPLSAPVLGDLMSAWTVRRRRYEGSRSFEVDALTHHLQVTRVCTSAIPAQMVDRHPCGYLAPVQPYGDSMGSIASVLTDGADTVARAINASEPRPASVGTCRIVTSAEVTRAIGLGDVHVAIIPAQPAGYLARMGRRS